MALPKAHRLRHRRDFSAVYQSGLRRSSANLTLRALKPGSERQAKAATESGTTQPTSVQAGQQSPKPSDSGQPLTRIGISISQKVSKRAVVRNRIKRQLKAIFRLLLPQMTPGWQLVVVVKSSATQCGYEQFLQELKQLLRSAEVIDGY